MASTRERSSASRSRKARVGAVRRGGRNVSRVGSQDVFLSRAYCHGGVPQGAVLCLGRSKRKRMRDFARGEPYRGHHTNGIGFVVAIFHALKTFHSYPAPLR